MTDSFHTELEALTGKTFVGDITPIVYDLLCTGNHLELLYKHLKGVSIKNDSSDDTRSSIREKSDNRPCFKEWFSHCERL